MVLKQTRNERPVTSAGDIRAQQSTGKPLHTVITNARSATMSGESKVSTNADSQPAPKEGTQATFSPNTLLGYFSLRSSLWLPCYQASLPRGFMVIVIEECCDLFCSADSRVSCSGSVEKSE